MAASTRPIGRMTWDAVNERFVVICAACGAAQATGCVARADRPVIVRQLETMGWVHGLDGRWRCPKCPTTRENTPPKEDGDGG